jgi:hypothetical protein
VANVAHVMIAFGMKPGHKYVVMSWTTRPVQSNVIDLSRATRRPMDPQCRFLSCVATTIEDCRQWHSILTGARAAMRDSRRGS